MRIILILAALLSALSAVATARAEGLHFISVAWIPSEKQQQYDSFSQAVAPIWARHGMKALLRAKVVGALAGGDEDDDRGGDEIDLPTEIAILSVASRASFENYIADPDYRAIRPQRMDAVRQMIVLEGTSEPDEDNPLFDTAPQFAMIFGASNGAAEAPAPAFTMRVELAGSIKGEVPNLFDSRPSVSLFALSYDDNPMSFVGQNSAAAPVFILQRHAP